MQQLTSLFSELIVLYLIAAVGYLAKRTGAFDDGGPYSYSSSIIHNFTCFNPLFLEFSFRFSLAKIWLFSFSLSLRPWCSNS